MTVKRKGGFNFFFIFKVFSRKVEKKNNYLKEKEKIRW